MKSYELRYDPTSQVHLSEVHPRTNLNVESVWTFTGTVMMTQEFKTISVILHFIH